MSEPSIPIPSVSTPGSQNLRWHLASKLLPRLPQRGGGRRIRPSVQPLLNKKRKGKEKVKESW